MIKALKIEIFLLCMIILIGLAVRSRRSLFSSTQQLLFSMLGYTSAAYIFFDMIWTLSDGVSTPVGITANWISNAVSFSLFAIACLIWFFYSETMQGSRLLTTPYRVVLLTLPTALVVVLAFTSYWTHTMFYIDAQGVYRRGALYRFSLSLATATSYIRPCMPLFRLEKSKACKRRPFIAPSPFLRFPLWWAVPSRFCFRYRALASV